MARKGTLTVRIVGDSSGLQKALGNAQSNLAKFAKAGALAAGAAIVGGVAASIKAFADFDQAMTQSVAIMGDVSDTMRKEMSDAARQVAKTTKFSATEAAESYFFLASAGLDAAASIEALPKVAAFAQAGAFDMARATDLLTDAQSALGLAVDDTAQNITNMSRVSDVLVKANTLANASVEQFSEALTEKAGAALRQLNKDVEEGVAVLAVYADQGTKGSAAGTQLNAVLEGLTRTARINADAYEELGVKVFDAEGEMRNMADIIGDMEGALDGMSTEASLAELAQLGLTRTARDGVVQLLGSADAIREYEKDLRSAGGVTDEIASKQMQTFWAKLGLVKDQFIDIGLSIGEALMPALEGFTDWLSAKLPAITGWFDNLSSRFNELLGVTEDTSDGAKVNIQNMVQEVWNFDENMKQVSGNTAAYLKTMEDNFDGVALEIWHFNDEMEQVKDKHGEQLDEMEGFWSKFTTAAKALWDTELKPWLENDFLPWFEDTAVPAMLEAGKAAGAAFMRGLAGSLPGAFLDSAKRTVTAPMDIGASLLDLAGFGSLADNIRGAKPGFLRHAGGTVPGLPSQQSLMLLRGTEEVSPVGNSSGGNVFHIYGEPSPVAMFRARNLAEIV